MRKDGQRWDLVSAASRSQDSGQAISKLCCFFGRECGDTEVPWLPDGGHCPRHSCRQRFGGRPGGLGTKSPPRSSLRWAGPLTSLPLGCFICRSGGLASCPASRLGQV